MSGHQEPGFINVAAYVSSRDNTWMTTGKEAAQGNGAALHCETNPPMEGTHDVDGVSSQKSTDDKYPRTSRERRET